MLRNLSRVHHLGAVPFAMPIQQWMSLGKSHGNYDFSNQEKPGTSEMSEFSGETTMFHHEILGYEATTFQFDGLVWPWKIYASPMLKPQAQHPQIQIQTQCGCKSCGFTCAYFFSTRPLASFVILKCCSQQKMLWTYSSNPFLITKLADIIGNAGIFAQIMFLMVHDTIRPTLESIK